MMSIQQASKQDIIDQLLQFGIGTKEEIIEAIDKVINKHDINEIADYIVTNQQKKHSHGDDNKSVK